MLSHCRMPEVGLQPRRQCGLRQRLARLPHRVPETRQGLEVEPVQGINGRWGQAHLSAALSEVVFTLDKAGHGKAKTSNKA